MFYKLQPAGHVCMFILDPGLMATLNPVMITGDIGSDPINLTCTASVIVSDIISAVYDFTWWRNGEVIDLSDDRIMVCAILYYYML